MLLEKALTNYFVKSQSVTPKISEKEYKMKAYINIREIRMGVRILKVEELGLTYCLSFTRFSGEYLAFAEVFKEIRNEMEKMEDVVI